MGFREADGFFSKIPFKKSGKNYLQWHHKRFPGIIFRITNLDDKAEIKLKDFDFFIVAEYEDAVFLNRGSFVSLAGKGCYELGKLSKQAGTEIIWVSKQSIKTKWGFQNAYSSDNVKVGSHGIAFIQITNPKNFVIKLLAGEQRFETSEIEKWIWDSLSSGMVTVFSRFTCEELVKERKSIEIEAKEELNADLEEWGLSLNGIEIQGVKIPEEYESVLAFESKNRAIKANAILEKEKAIGEVEVYNIKKEMLSEEKEQTNVQKMSREDKEELKKYEELLERLTERFVLGELSEDTFKEISNKYKQKIKELTS